MEKEVVCCAAEEKGPWESSNTCQIETKVPPDVPDVGIQHDNSVQIYSLLFLSDSVTI